MDLSNISVVETVDVELKNPKTDAVLVCDDETVMSLTICGPYTKEFKKYFHNFNGAKATESDSADMDFLVAVTRDWNIQENGEKPAFSKNALKDFLKRHPWVMEQVTFTALDKGNFILTK